MVFFFRISLVVLQMEIDRLRNFHGAPPCFGLCGQHALTGVYTMMQKVCRGREMDRKYLHERIYQWFDTARANL